MTQLSEILNSNFTTTAVVSMFLGYLTYRQARAGQRDADKQQEKANAVSETKLAMEAYKDLYQTSEVRRKEAEAENAQLRKLVRKDFEEAIQSCDVEPSRKRKQQPKEGL